jgi:hypothetical protein
MNGEDLVVMKPSLALGLLLLLLAAPLARALPLVPEVGVSYFWLRDARIASSSPVLAVDEPGRAAPYVALTYGVNARLGLRLSYHHIDDARTTSVLGSPPGALLPIVVWEHLRDDIHVASLAPEFTWPLGPTTLFAVAPQLNWVGSKGVVSYSTDNPLVLLIGPTSRRDDGFTVGGSIRFRQALGTRAALSLGYQFVDLDPSFDRRAHVLTGGVSWRF